MARLGPSVKALLIFGLALRIHHHFQGPPIGYAGVTAAAAASWIGVPGPGEPVLITAAVLAAQHRLDIASVLAAAWLGATAGGIGGWLIGMKAGRAVLTTRGPLHTMRLGALARGDAVFSRYPVVAILLTPSWVAGIHHVRPAVYLPTNAAGAAVWTLGIGLGAYYVGPTIVDLVDDIGLAAAIALAVLVLGVVAAEIARRRRHR